MKLSILIPSIPSRFDKMQLLYRKLSNQIKECKAEKDVEILIWIDNKMRSIGKKRDDLVQSSQADYLAFVDDDDDVAGEYMEEMLKGCDAGMDLICFKQQATLVGKDSTMWSYIDFSLFHENEEIQNHSITRRKPFHVCGIKTKVAQQERFKDIGYKEDWDWMQRVLNHCETEWKSNEVIHYYTYDNRISKAPVESNEVFTNLDLEYKRKHEKSDNKRKQ